MSALAAWASVGALAADDGRKPGSDTELEPIVVTPQVAPLDEPYQRLRKMMEDPYCEGCPPLRSVDRESVYLKAGKVLGMFTGYGLAPPELSHEDRLDLHLMHDWRQAERIPEN